MADINLKTRLLIRTMANAGIAIGIIAEDCDVSIRSVYNILDGKGEDRIRRTADRLEYFSEGGSSGCYHNGVLMLSDEQLSAGDPLEELIAMETIEERLNG